MKIPCHQLSSPEKWICLADCDTRLNCGHQCLSKCHLLNDPDHLKYHCKKTCARNCINDHQCRKKHPCYEECDPCNVSTSKTLSCGHVINVSCSRTIENWKCKEPCQREELPCGHKCEKTCAEPCIPCIVSLKLSHFYKQHNFQINISVVQTNKLFNLCKD